MPCLDRSTPALRRIVAACFALAAATTVPAHIAHGQPHAKDPNASMTEDDGLRHADIVASTPITAETGLLRPERLIDMPVESLQGEWLGKIHGTVVSPDTGKIVYLIIVRDDDRALFQKLTPVPWTDFSVAASVGRPERLVLNTTRAILADAPIVADEQVMARQDSGKQRKLVDTYWLEKLS